MALQIDDKAKQPDKRQGTGFTNLQNLMDANKNNRLGQAVGTGVQGQFDQAKDTLGQSQNKFQTDIGGARQAFDTNKQTVNSALQNVAKADDKAAGAFNTVLGGEYKGPSALENQDTIAARTASAQQLGNLGASEGGKVELLKRFAGGPQYTSGQSKLDSALLGQGGSNILSSIRRQSAELGNQANQAITGAQEQSKELQGQTSQLARDTLGNLQNQYTGTQAEIDKQIADTNAQRAAQVATAQQQLKTGRVDPALLKQLGLSAGMQTFGVDMSDLISQDLTQGNRLNAATADQSAKLAALGKLAGSHFDPSQLADTQQFINNQQAGTFGAAPSVAMSNAAKQTVQNRIAASKQDLGNQINAAAQGYKDVIDWQREMNGKVGDHGWLHDQIVNSDIWKQKSAAAEQFKQLQKQLQNEYKRREGLTLQGANLDDSAHQVGKVGVGKL